MVVCECDYWSTNPETIKLIPALVVYAYLPLGLPLYA